MMFFAWIYACIGLSSFMESYQDLYNMLYLNTFNILVLQSLFYISIKYLKVKGKKTEFVASLINKITTFADA